MREQLINGFKIWTERTSTSPEGRHLGLYKTWIHKEPEENVKNEIHPDHFFDIILLAMQISIKHSEPLERWGTVHNLFLLKEQGNYKIHRLRFLHKIDAELNLIRREIVARRLMKNSERHKYIVDEQYGGRNGRAASDVILLKEFTLAIMYMQRSNGAITDCDAKACYDRILTTIAALTNYKAGLPEHMCTFFAKALKQMRYHM
eukprot:scaffold84859_cov54-Attheya_sp.AAC.1